MYEILKEMVKPEPLVLVPVLYLLGVAVKRSAVADKWIPWILGGAGVVMSGIYVFASTVLVGWQEALLAVFTAVVQGVLCAGASVYVNQMVKQAGKGE